VCVLGVSEDPVNGIAALDWAEKKVESKMVGKGRLEVPFCRIVNKSGVTKWPVADIIRKTAEPCPLPPATSCIRWIWTNDGEIRSQIYTTAAQPYGWMGGFSWAVSLV
jgi:hypothetical protein